MGQEAKDRPVRKEALQKLREARKDSITAAATRMKDQRKIIAAIKKALQEGEMTVPEIATVTGIPSTAVLWYLATLKKYGQIAEGAAAGSYFRYRLVEGAAAEK